MISALLICTRQRCFLFSALEPRTSSWEQAHLLSGPYQACHQAPLATGVSPSGAIGCYMFDARCMVASASNKMIRLPRLLCRALSRFLPQDLLEDFALKTARQNRVSRTSVGIFFVQSRVKFAVENVRQVIEKRRDACPQSTCRAQRKPGPRKPQICNVQIRNLVVLDKLFNGLYQ